MNRTFSIYLIRISLSVAVVCTLNPASLGGEENQEDAQIVFPLLSDIPEVPEGISTIALEKEQRFLELVAELESERKEILEQLEKSRQAILRGGE